MGQRQAVGADNGGGSTSIAIAVASTAAGSGLVVVAGTAGNTTLSSVTDNLGQTWTVRSTASNLHVAEKLGSAAGVTGVTLNLAASIDGSAIFIERDDLAASAAFDQLTAQNNQTLTGASTWSSAASSALAQATEVGIAFSFSSTGGGVFNGAGAGWTAVAGTNITGGSHDNPSGDSFFAEQQSFSSTTAVTATGSTNISAGTKSAAVFYKLAASVPTDTLLLLL